MPNEEEIKKRYAKFVAKVWGDEGFRQRLMSDPAAVLRESGFDVPEGKEVKILEVDVEKTIHFILPTKPAEPFSEIDVEQGHLFAKSFVVPPCR
jgi:hypothetical protein